MAERLIASNGIGLWTEDFGDRRNPTLLLIMGASAPRDRRPLLRKTSIPAVVIHGTQDPILPYPHGQALAQAIPGAKLLTIDGMGHDLPASALPEIIGAMVAVTQRG